MNRVKLKWLVSASNAGEVIDKSHWGDGRESLYTCAREVLRSDFNNFPNWKRTQPQDLLLTRNGTPYIHIPVEGAIYSNVVQRISVPNVDKFFLRYALEDRVRSFKGYGVSIESLNYEMWSNLEVALPDQTTQRQIAKFLDREVARIDILIKKKQRLLALLEDKVESEISQSLGIRNGFETTGLSGIWPSSLPEGWTVPKLTHFATVGNGSTPSRENSAFWSDNGLPWLNSGAIHQRDVKSSPFNVTKQALENCHLPIVNPGDLLIAITGQGKTRGTAAICRMTATVSQHIAYIRLQKTSGMLPEFLLLSLRASYRYLRDQSAGIGSTRAALTCDYLKSFHVPKPPIETQISLVEKVAKAERACSSVSAKTQSSIEKLQEYRSALITAAVTGQIDVASHSKSGATERKLGALQEEMGA